MRNSDSVKGHTNHILPPGKMSEETKVYKLPPLYLDCNAFDLVFTRRSTPDKLQLVTGHVDGTLRLYSAKSREVVEEELRARRQEREQELEIAKQIEREIERREEEKIDFEHEKLDELSDSDLYGPSATRGGGTGVGVKDAETEDYDEDADLLQDEEDIDYYELDWAIQHTKKGSVRALAHMPKSDAVVSVSSVGTFAMADVEAGKLVFNRIQKIPSAFEKITVISENTVVTGDDEGRIALWDIRDPRRTAMVTDATNSGSKSSKGNTTKSVDPNSPELAWIGQRWEHHDHADYISGLRYNSTRHEVVSASGDGHMAIYDIVSGRFLKVTERLQGELMSLEVSEKSDILLYGLEYGHVLGAFREDFASHLQIRMKRGSVDALRIDPHKENLMYAGCEDGTVTVLDIEACRFYGVLGIHRAPVGVIVADPGSSIVGVASKDDKIHFWDSNDIERSKRARMAEEGDDENDDDDDEDGFDLNEDEDSSEAFGDDSDDDNDDDDDDDGASDVSDSDDVDDSMSEDSEDEELEMAQPKKKVKTTAATKKPAKPQPSKQQTTQAKAKGGFGFFDGL